MYRTLTCTKGKAVPLQAWNGPKGSGKLRFPNFLKTAQDGDKVFSLTHRPHVLYKEVKVKQSRSGVEWPRGFQEVKVPRFLDNGTEWW
jgi:hypothetical protein